ncbi:WD repeat-containing protein 76-like [Elysia marginata]|uniref:WD repeat-containing protein 76 n=1 Tax=Elysia marginata TaxID=1093978 RepID=A0AAV4I8J3_9GAST|nr:WD repeat-containing protein 76-like [Elysia marginata]
MLTTNRVAWRTDPATNLTSAYLSSVNYVPMVRINDILNRGIIQYLAYFIMVTSVLILSFKLYQASKMRQSCTIKSPRPFAQASDKPVVQTMSTRDMQVVKSTVLVCSIFILAQLPYIVSSTIRLINPEFDTGKSEEQLSFIFTQATFSKMLERGVEKSNCHATVSRVSSFQVDIGQAVFDLMGNLADESAKMRRSLRQLQKNQLKAESAPSNGVSPTKQQRLTSVKVSCVKLSTLSPDTIGEHISGNLARKRKFPVKQATDVSPSKHKLVSISSGVKPTYSKASPVKTEKKEWEAFENSPETSPKADENKDPTDFKRLSPRKARGNSPVKTMKKDDFNAAKVDIKLPIGELGSDGSDVEQDESLSYAQIREKNLRENELFFASLGIDQAKEMLHASATKLTKKPTQRGLKVKKEVEILPRRHSLRIKRIDPEGNQLPEPEPVIQVVEPTRLPCGPVGMKECLKSKNEKDNGDLITSFQSLMKGEKVQKDSPHGKKPSEFISGLKNMSISEKGVAKVVPERVFSVAWHPARSPLIAIAGDKWGAVGLWNVFSEDEDQLVTAFKPHTRPVSCLKVPSAAQHKLYSCSYDATLRCGDFEKGIFNEVFSVPEEHDDLFRNFCFYDDFRTMLVSHFSGNVSLVDVRTPKTTAEQVFKVSHKSLRTVSNNPLHPDHFITAGTDTNICLWDMRKMNQKSPKPLQILGEHTRAIASAYFSPLGDKIVSSAADDQILVYDVPQSQSGPGSEIQLSKRIRHNNCTGRWLTNFQPTWHPAVPNVFVVGSMARPREIQVYDASSGAVMRSLSDEDHLGSVCSLNVFHPNRPCTLVGANSSGRLHVFL